MQTVKNWNPTLPTTVRLERESRWTDHWWTKKGDQAILTLLKKTKTISVKPRIPNQLNPYVSPRIRLMTRRTPAKTAICHWPRHGWKKNVCAPIPKASGKKTNVGSKKLLDGRPRSKTVFDYLWGGVTGRLEGERDIKRFCSNRILLQYNDWTKKSLRSSETLTTTNLQAYVYRRVLCRR